MRSVTYIPEQAIIATPASPQAGYSKLYQKPADDWYVLDDAGAEKFAFSTNFELFQSAGVSSTTLNTFQDKISGTTGVLPAGLYEVATSYSWNFNSVTNDFVAQLLVDGTSVESSAFDMHRQEPQDSAGGVAGTGTDQAHGFSRVDYLSLAAGTHTVVLQYMSAQAGISASIWSAKVSLKRVQ